MPEVKEETRERIEETIAEVGLVPDEVAGGTPVYLPYGCRSVSCVDNGKHRTTFFSREVVTTCPNCKKESLKPKTARIFLVVKAASDDPNAFQGSNDDDGVPRYWKFANKKFNPHIHRGPFTNVIEDCNDYDSLIAVGAKPIVLGE